MKSLWHSYCEIGQLYKQHMHWHNRRLPQESLDLRVCDQEIFTAFKARHVTHIGKNNTQTISRNKFVIAKSILKCQSLTYLSAKNAT